MEQAPIGLAETEKEFLSPAPPEPFDSVAPFGAEHRRQMGRSSEVVRFPIEPITASR